MTHLQALIYGIIQGLTEFLPISSTAHLRVVPALLGWDDPGAAFTAVIQIGTLVAVFLYFRADIMQLTSAFWRGLVAGKPFASHDARLAWMIGVGTVPIVVAGLSFQKYIKSELRELHVIAYAFIVVALILMFAEWLVYRRHKAFAKEKGLQDLGWGETLFVGIAQAFALIPGTSRSGATIAGGLFSGMSRETAARFSFLLSLPSIFAAGIYELFKERKSLLASGTDVVNILLAAVVAGIVGYAAIAFLLAYLKKHSTCLFIIYRLLLGAFLFAGLATGRLAP